MATRSLAALLASGWLAVAAGMASGASPIMQRDAAQSVRLGDEEVRAQVWTYLSAIDTPIDAALWKALGPRATPVLVEIAGDRGNFPTIRAKALDALSIVGGVNSAATFRAAARDDSEPFVVRFSAMRALARTGEAGSSQGDLAALASTAGDPRIRAAAAEAMARADAKGSCAIVQSQASRESDDARRYYQRALRLCQGQ